MNNMNTQIHSLIGENDVYVQINNCIMDAKKSQVRGVGIC